MADDEDIPILEQWSVRGAKRYSGYIVKPHFIGQKKFWKQLEDHYETNKGTTVENDGGKLLITTASGRMFWLGSVSPHNDWEAKCPKWLKHSGVEGEWKPAVAPEGYVN